MAGVPARMAPAGTWHVTATGSSIIPHSRKDLGWIIGDHGFELILSKRVPGLIRANLRPWMTSWLAVQRGLGRAVRRNVR